LRLAAKVRRELYFRLHDGKVRRCFQLLTVSADTLGGRFIRTAKREWRTFCMADSTGRSLTFGRTLVASLLLARILRTLAARGSSVGLLLPASVGGALANIAVSLAGYVPVNLNFTAGRDAMTAAIEQCRISTILTSRTFLAKAEIAPLAGMVFIEDLFTQMSGVARARMLLIARLLPTALLERLYCAPLVRAHEPLAAVIFSSGSTGVPKGVMLTHRNILANVDAVHQVFTLTRDDIMLGILPFFHSFGFMGTLWFPVITGFGVVYHPNPMDAKTIGELAATHRATLLISTPTFCGSYIRKIRPEQFATLRYAIVGAERLRETTATAFKDKFGLDLIEGYGCTEMAPIVAANVPELRAGTVGRALPGVSAKVVDPATGEGPLIGKEGLLLVKGENQMVGYVNQPRQTGEALRDGWYVTGDIATIDQDGFIRITDRMSRFSKIAGEMVPHMKIEEEIQARLDESFACVVTSVPDAVKGERLVAFYTDPDLSPQELWDRLGSSGLPKLWLPKRDDLRFMESIPTLGTGKIDLRAVRQAASPADDA
jgi:acyl-[acyl-carrier-protein]-phospholipid O-acyltransferase/long-chain-fatty-acid--[acyl-carrier-protein] ligase